LTAGAVAVALALGHGAADAVLVVPVVADVWLAVLVPAVAGV
jgi:hypothetical protein